MRSGLLTMTQAARFTGVSVQAVAKWCKAARIDSKAIIEARAAQLWIKATKSEGYVNPLGENIALMKAKRYAKVHGLRKRKAKAAEPTIAAQSEPQRTCWPDPEL